MTLDQPPLVVTPGGHDLSVWAPALNEARHVPFTDLAAALSPDRPCTLLVAGAHPDDETLGLGRLAYAWAEQIGPVTGVLASAGEACVDHVAPRPAGIAARRIEEWNAAVSRLGFTDRHLLGLPDGRVSEHEDALVERLTELATAAGTSGPVVLAAPWRSDPHPDHRAVGRAAARVPAARSVTLIEFPVWMTYWSSPASVAAAGQELLVVQHDPSADLAQREATLAFRSQLQPLAPHLTPVVPAAMLAHQRRQLLLVEPTLAARLPTRAPAHP
jgi:LmbE family N-acetylglucosaminyl deacetylase